VIDLRHWLRSPLLHFVILGGLVFTAERLLTATSTVSAGTSRPATESLSADEILLRDALAIGLDRTDPLVRERLVRLGESIVTDDITERAALEREARRLGLDHSDPVVRRRLVHAMTLALSRVDPSEWPGEEELQAHYERNRDRYVQPARYHFDHVYFARDREGMSAQSAAGKAMDYLERKGTVSSAAGVGGDAFLLGSEFSMSDLQLERRFGPKFAAAFKTAPIGQWTGPLESPFGLHLVWLSQRIPAASPAFDSVRGRVVHDLLAEREAQQLERRIGQRRETYGQ
jgi:hypothetical protein